LHFINRENLKVMQKNNGMRSQHIVILLKIREIEIAVDEIHIRYGKNNKYLHLVYSLLLPKRVLE